MAKRKLGKLPFPPLVKVSASEPLTVHQVHKLLADHPSGVSFCVRSGKGHRSRGGYFFHLKPIDEACSECEVYSFEKTLVAKLPLDMVTVFVNHCSGLAFDDWAFGFCQSVVNLRLDPE